MKDRLIAIAVRSFKRGDPISTDLAMRLAVLGVDVHELEDSCS